MHISYSWAWNRMVIIVRQKRMPKKNLCRSFRIFTEFLFLCLCTFIFTSSCRQVIVTDNLRNAGRVEYFSFYHHSGVSKISGSRDKSAYAPIMKNEVWVHEVTSCVSVAFTENRNRFGARNPKCMQPELDTCIFDFRKRDGAERDSTEVAERGPFTIFASLLRLPWSHVVGGLRDEHRK